HRLRDALDDMANILGETRRICVARELTKVFEEFQRGTVAQLREHFANNEPRGEFTLVLEGHGARGGRTVQRASWSDAQVRREFSGLVEGGMQRNQAVKEIARRTGRDRRAVYDLTAGKTNENKGRETNGAKRQ